MGMRRSLPSPPERTGAAGEPSPKTVGLFSKASTLSATLPPDRNLRMGKPCELRGNRRKEGRALFNGPPGIY